MKKFNLILLTLGIVAATISFACARGHIQVLSDAPLRIVPLFPQPKVIKTPFTVFTDTNTDVPIIILVNKSGKTFPDWTQVFIFVDDNLGVMSHAKAALPNGEQRIILPYIRKGGKVRVVTSDTTFRSKEPLQSGKPMIITFLPDHKFTVNAPYHSDLE
jgi:hypothetical protein